jgi:type IV secretory pathway TraG/TraD family ATPase VirD4
MAENSYQGFEILKHQTKMRVRMYSRIVIFCLLLQPLVFLALIHLKLNFAFEMVPAPHRELAWKWPVARLERALSRDGTFLLHSEELPHWWSGAQEKVVKVRAEKLVRLPYSSVFTSREAHWGLALFLSFAVWPFWFALRYFQRRLLRRIRNSRLSKVGIPRLTKAVKILSGWCCWPWLGEQLRTLSARIGRTKFVGSVLFLGAKWGAALGDSVAVSRAASLLAALRTRANSWRGTVAVCLLLQLFFLVLLFQVRLNVGFDMVPAPHRELALKWPVARLQQAIGWNGKFRLHSEEEKHWWNGRRAKVAVVGARELVRLPYPLVFSSPEAHWLRAVELSFLSWLVLPAVLWKSRRVARKMDADQHIRGAQICSEEELAEICGDGILYIGGIRISEALSRRHILIVGQSGSGKSNLTLQHLTTIRHAKRRVIANDFKGNLVERFYRPGCDLILNPLDARGVGWTLFNDIESMLDLAAIVGILIPLGKGTELFWNSAARDVLRGVMAYCYKFGTRTNRDLCRALTSSIAEIAEMCRATEAGRAGYRYLQDSNAKIAEDIIAVLTSHVNWLEYAPDGDFSLRRWVETPGDVTIFVTSLDEASDIMKPYLSLVTELAAKRLLSLPEIEDPGNSIYLLLDELGNMHRLPSVKRLLTAGRSKGVVVEVGIQDLASVVSVYGPEDTKTIINNCGSKMIMNLGESEVAELCSDLCGDEDFWQVSTSYSIDPDAKKVTENHSRQQKTRRVVTSTQLRRLKVGQGYFMFPGGNPAMIEVPWAKENKHPVCHAKFELRAGLSMEDLKIRNIEITAAAKEAMRGDLPKELEKLHDQNAPERKQHWAEPDEALGADQALSIDFRHEFTGEK